MFGQQFTKCFKFKNKRVANENNSTEFSDSLTSKEDIDRKLLLNSQPFLRLANPSSDSAIAKLFSYTFSENPWTNSPCTS